MNTFCIIHKGNRNNFKPRVPTNPFAHKCVLIFYIIYVKASCDSGGGGGV